MNIDRFGFNKDYDVKEDIEVIEEFILDNDKDLLFITLGGSYMHGFESPKSDKDYRVVHMEYSDEFFGMNSINGVINKEEDEKVSFVSYELGQFCNHLYKMNCNMLEQLFAETIVYIHPMYKRKFHELRMYILNMLSKKGMFDSYNGLIMNNYKKYIINDNHVTNKKYLYLLKNSLSLQHALSTGKIEPNIKRILENDISLLSDSYLHNEVDVIQDLIEHKQDGASDDILTVQKDRVDSLITKCMDLNKWYYDQSKLPEKPTDSQRDTLNEWLINFRKYPI